MNQKVNRSLDASVRFGVSLVLLSAWAWPVWRLIWTRDLPPGLVGLLVALWLLPGHVLLVRALALARPARLVYVLMPFAALLGMVLGGFLVLRLADVLATAGLLMPVIGVWLVCTLVWPVVRLAQHRHGARRLLILVVVAVCAFGVMLGWGRHDLVSIPHRLEVGLRADWPLGPGAALGVCSLAAVASLRSRRAHPADPASAAEADVRPAGASS